MANILASRLLLRAFAPADAEDLHHRQGYMSEAVEALVRHGFAHAAIHRVVAHCNSEHPAPWRLLEKIGFRREGLLRQNIFFHQNALGEPIWTDTRVYAMFAAHRR